MRRVFVLLVLLAMAGCAEPEQEPTFVPVEQQNVMTRMTVAAGYEIAGVPQYEETRWTANVRVPGCTTTIKLAGNEAPESAHPTSFTVLSIGEVPFDQISPGTDTNNMSATALRSLDGMEEKLVCAT